MKYNHGFTLIELLTVLSILGILAFAALPSFAQFIKQDRIVSTTNSLMSTMTMNQQGITTATNASCWR